MNLQEQKEFYDKYWRENKKLNSLKLRRAVKILEYFIRVKKKKQTPKVIDLGCGDGRLSSFIGEFGNVDAIELSEEAIENAKIRFPHVNFFQGDVFSYDFEWSTYDLVISQEVIEHVYDQDTYLNICGKCLKVGGFLILTTPNKKVLDRMNDSHNWSNQPIENVIEPSKLKKLLKNEFEIIEFDTIIMNFGDIGYFKIINSRFMIGLLNYLKLRKVRLVLLGKMGFGLHQCVLAKKK